MYLTSTLLLLLLIHNFYLYPQTWELANEENLAKLDEEHRAEMVSNKREFIVKRIEAQETLRKTLEGSAVYLYSYEYLHAYLHVCLCSYFYSYVCYIYAVTCKQLEGNAEYLYPYLLIHVTHGRDHVTGEASLRMTSRRNTRGKRIRVLLLLHFVYFYFYLYSYVYLY